MAESEINLVVHTLKKVWQNSDVEFHIVYNNMAQKAAIGMKFICHGYIYLHNLKVNECS